MSQSFTPLPFEIDHVIAAMHAGPTVAGNLALACVACNLRKGPNIAGMDPETGLIAALFHPRRDLWTDHFRWRLAVLVGVTPAGRATVQVLGINAQNRVAHRSALLRAGEWPLD